MGYIPPNENGSPKPIVGPGTRSPGFGTRAPTPPTPMPIRGALRPPVSKAPTPLPVAGVGTRPPLDKRLGGSTYFANRNRIAMNRNAKKMSYAAAAKRKLMN